MAQGTVKSLVSSLNSKIMTNEAANASAYRNVWFSDSTDDLKRVHDTDFQYNPGTNDLKVGTINGKTVKQITIKDYQVQFDGWQSGTPGTRAEQKSVDVTGDIQTLGSVHTVSIVDITDSSRANYQAFMSGNSIFVNAYRANESSSGSGYPITVRAMFVK